MRYIIFGILTLLLISCNHSTENQKGDILARVHDEYLYEADLVNVVPEGSNARDSLVLIRNFINNWIRQKLLVHKAELNLPKEQKDFSKQLEEYRNSLIIYEYERKLIQQELDTIVPFAEIQEYYDNYKHNFMLYENIFQIDYIKTDKDSPLVARFRNLLNSGRLEDRDTLQHLCPVHASNYNISDDNWLNFNTINRMFPFHTFNEQDFLSINNFIEFRENDFIFMLFVRDVRLKDNFAPPGYVSAEIRDIIINKRKVEFIKRMHSEIINQAVQNDDFEIY